MPGLPIQSSSISVRVLPGAARDEIVGWHGGALKVKVRAAPENGRANAAVLDLLAAALKLPRRAVTLASGHAARQKRIQVAGLAAEVLCDRLTALAGPMK